MSIQTADVLTLAAWGPTRPVTGLMLRAAAAALNLRYNWNSTSVEEAHTEVNAARAKNWISTMLPWRNSTVLAATSEAAATVRVAYIMARVARYLQSERLAGYSAALLYKGAQVKGSKSEVIAAIYDAGARAVAEVVGEEGKNINDPEIIRALYYLGATVRGKPARDIAALSAQHRYDLDPDKDREAARARVVEGTKAAAGEQFENLIAPLRTAAGEQYDKLRGKQDARRHRRRLRAQRAKLIRNLGLVGGAAVLIVLIGKAVQGKK